MPVVSNSLRSGSPTVKCSRKSGKQSAGRCSGSRYDPNFRPAAGLLARLQQPGYFNRTLGMKSFSLESRRSEKAPGRRTDRLLP